MPRERPNEHAWRTAAVLLWCAVALAYVAYCALNFTGLYAWLATLEQDRFGAFDPFLTFIVLLIGLCLPTRLFAPTLQARGRRAAVDPVASQRALGRTVWTIAALLFVVGVGSGGFALWRGTRVPVVVKLDLARHPAIPEAADQLVVTGHAQWSRTVTVTETFRGSNTKTAYTPLTSPDWNNAEPVRFVMRRGLASEGDDTRGQADASRPIRFGPAALLRHELPGLVRSGFAKSGTTLASDAVVLDENLESANFTLWIVAFFGISLAAGLGIVRVLAARTQARRATRTASAAASRRDAGQNRGAAPRRWRLMLGSELMAELSFESYETPWITVSVAARPGLAPFVRYFGDAEQWPDDDPTIDDMVAEVHRRGRFRLIDDAGYDVKPFTLMNVNATSANLRC